MSFGLSNTSPLPQSLEIIEDYSRSDGRQGATSRRAGKFATAGRPLGIAPLSRIAPYPVGWALSVGSFTLAASPGSRRRLRGVSVLRYRVTASRRKRWPPAGNVVAAVTISPFTAHSCVTVAGLHVTRSLDASTT